MKSKLREGKGKVGRKGRREETQGEKESRKKEQDEEEEAIGQKQSMSRKNRDYEVLSDSSEERKSLKEAM